MSCSPHFLPYQPTNPGWVQETPSQGKHSEADAPMDALPPPCLFGSPTGDGLETRSPLEVQSVGAQRRENWGGSVKGGRVGSFVFFFVVVFVCLLLETKPLVVFVFFVKKVNPGFWPCWLIFYVVSHIAVISLLILWVVLLKQYGFTRWGLEAKPLLIERRDLAQVFWCILKVIWCVLDSVFLSHSGFGFWRGNCHCKSWFTAIVRVDSRHYLT